MTGPESPEDPEGCEAINGLDVLRQRGLAQLGRAFPDDATSGGVPAASCAGCGAACLDTGGAGVLCGVCVSRHLAEVRDGTWARHGRSGGRS